MPALKKAATQRHNSSTQCSAPKITSCSNRYVHAPSPRKNFQKHAQKFHQPDSKKPLPLKPKKRSKKNQSLKSKLKQKLSQKLNKRRQKPKGKHRRLLQKKLRMLPTKTRMKK